MAPDVAATIRTAPAAAPDSGNAPPPDASLAPPLAEPEKLPEKANTPLAAPRLSTLPAATPVNGTTPVAMPAVLTAPAANPEYHGRNANLYIQVQQWREIIEGHPVVHNIAQAMPSASWTLGGSTRTTSWTCAAH